MHRLPRSPVKDSNRKETLVNKSSGKQSSSLEHICRSFLLGVITKKMGNFTLKKKKNAFLDPALKFRRLGSGICLFSHPSPNTILMICRFGIHTSAGGFLASGRKGQGAKDSDSTKSSQRSLVGRWRACGTMIFAVMFSLATLIKYRSYSRSRWALGSQGSGCDGQHLHRVLHCCKQSTGYA